MIERSKSRNGNRKTSDKLALTPALATKLSGERHETADKRRGVESPHPHTANDWFHHFAHRTAEMVGRPWTFSIAVATIVLWLAFGPMFHFSDTWQLVINTATTIVTFLMVFLIQNTQNRDARAIHLKLDELLHGVKGARNRLIDLEELSEDELKQLHDEFERVRKKSPPESCESKTASRE
jgi:low affinity Fe/Cu permease